MQTNCHLSVLIHEQAKKYGTKTALTFRNFGSLTWKSVSWNQFSARVKQVSNALLNIGIKPQETIAVFSKLHTVSLHRFWRLWRSRRQHSVLCHQF